MATNSPGTPLGCLSIFSPSERSPIRVRRNDPEDKVAAKTGSDGCQDRDVNDIVLLGRD